MNKHESLISAINNKKIVKLTFASKEKGTISRKCIPFDYGPSRKFKDGQNRYHFYDLDSPDGSHNLSVIPSQISDIKILDENFDPKEYIKWKPNWFVKRDWSIYS